MRDMSALPKLKGVAKLKGAANFKSAVELKISPGVKAKASTEPTITKNTRDNAFRAFALPADHPGFVTGGRVMGGKVGVLVLNLGTPDGTSYWPMRRYLSQFLSDKRVIDWPAAIWQPILQGIILSVRPGRKGRDYASIWNNERDEGPLLSITRSQAEKLAAELAPYSDKVIVDFAMRYGNPATGPAIERLLKQGCERILLLPMYPQYSGATTATAADEAFRQLMKMEWQPALRVAPPWHDDPVYIDALTTSVREHLATLDFEPEVLIASFHGVPQRYLLKGDPYHCQCMKTGRLLRETLNWPKDRFRTTFQSRFGPEQWLKPYTDKTMEELAKSGVKRMAVIAPGFAADCLETLEELEIENREIFLHNGGEKFSYIPCLNDSDLGIEVMKAVALRELGGWI
jgi:protoporphyrin/coproporphyrin ferrochelatase